MSTTAEALTALVDVLATDSRDWSRTRGDAWLYGVLVSTADARHLHPVLAYGVLKRYPIRSRDRARTKPTPCVCPDLPHPMCWTVTCRCDHGIGAP